MEDCLQFLQVGLSKDFGFTDDQVIESLQSSMDELRKAKMHLPPKAKNPEIELPTKPFGLFVPQSVEQVIGRRTMESKEDILQGKKRTSSIMRAIIPADGGLPSVVNYEHNRTSQISSASRGSHTDYSFDGTVVSDPFGSRPSEIDYQSSRTSNWDSDRGSVGTAHSNKLTPQFSADGQQITNSSNRQLNQSAENIRLRKHVTSRSPSKSPTSPTNMETTITNDDITDKINGVQESMNKQNVPDNSNARSQVSVYDNVPVSYESQLDNTLESMDGNVRSPVTTKENGVTVVEVNGHSSYQYQSPPSDSLNLSSKTSPNRRHIYEYHHYSESNVPVSPHGQNTSPLSPNGNYSGAVINGFSSSNPGRKTKASPGDVPKSFYL